ncbi:MAG: 2-phospho-L-lactate transferase [Promethearchaeota archaeon]
MEDKFYLILAGGVGAAKFIEGLINVIDQQLLKIIVNTGDDIELFGLKICPDIDIITYTLAGIVDKSKGWGFKEETFNCLSILKKYYGMDWFNAGDKDLATHIFRTDLLNRGYKKSEVTKIICEKLGVTSEIIPMSNEDVFTFIETPEGKIHFEEFYIKYQCKPKVLRVHYMGIENAHPVDGVLEYIKKAEKIIICPSNPIVSIGTILNVKNIKNALIKVKEKIIAISPIIKGLPIKGPADKLLISQGFESSCLGVAKYYKDLLGTFIIDIRDKDYKRKIKNLGIRTFCFDTLMTNLDKKRQLAEHILNINLN